MPPNEKVRQTWAVEGQLVLVVRGDRSDLLVSAVLNSLSHRWTCIAVLLATDADDGAVVNDHSHVSIYEIDEQWNVFSFAGPLDNDPEVLFERHAHEALGSFKALAEAIAVAEDYVRAWGDGRRPVAPPCTCEKIAPADAIGGAP